MKKMDEMELSITQKGIKWSWFFMAVALSIWGAYDLVKTQSTSLPHILLSRDDYEESNCGSLLHRKHLPGYLCIKIVILY